MSFQASELGEHVGVERARDVGDVDDAGFERIADLERRHGLGAADVVDADLALALGVHNLDEALEAAGIEGLLRKRGYAFERHLLSAAPDEADSNSAAKAAANQFRIMSSLRALTFVDGWSPSFEREKGMG